MMALRGWLTGRRGAASSATEGSTPRGDRQHPSSSFSTSFAASGSAGAAGISPALALGAGSTGGLTGAGVEIGIISDSFDALGAAAADEASGALPSGVTVLKDGASGHDEGRAMAEVAHAVAPGAGIAFCTAGGSAAGLAAAVAALQAAGCTVICDDVTCPDEPFFQMGDAAEQAISSFTAAGGVYFTAASNAGPASAYQASFSATAADLPGVGAVTAENFGSAAAPQTTDTLELKARCPTTVELQWAQPWASIDGAGAAYSLAFAVYDPSGALVKVASADRRGADPIQTCTFTPTTTGTYTVAVWVNGGTDPGGTFKIVANNSNASAASFGDEAGNTTAFGGSNGSGSIFGHNMDPQAVTVGAVDAADTPAAGGTPRSEAFSAAGPGEELYSSTGAALAAPKVLHGVAVSGPDGIATTLPASDLNPFHGTSCATPAVAAVGALMKQADPSMNAGEVKRALEGTALAFGTRDQAGAGLVQAAGALALARESNTTIRDNVFGDGQTALVWQDGSGAAEIARVVDDGVTGTSALAGPAPGPGWAAVASGDFSGAPGRADLLWQDGAGALAVENMDGSAVAGRTALGSPGAGWTVAGTGDFDGDGNSDILFTDAAGDAKIWTMDGADVTGRASLAGPGAGWTVAGIGDLDGDGRSDVVWQDGHGDIALWIMRGTSVASELQLAGPGAGWSVAGVGDVTGDGRADVLWQDGSGALDLWTMHGTAVSSTAALSTGLGAGWRAAGLGEFGGSGRDGILLQNADGAAAIAEVHHGKIKGVSPIASPGAGWTPMLG